ncbi:hypothetical protein CHR29_17025 [Pseudomonas monteilii]|uniref:Uncharacterized protein n=1 Tax=Pseudomonas monteilii TaxID=76759 RepID=A0AAP7FIX0_9PSED|nr:hypothetical protein CHR29_17025 [Pseudomonas monteilii]AYN99626.1 hypothetical protein D8767_11860 [Pseudomonas sp. LTGT-11-2Z]OAH45089.1 hypothetical protein AYJ70_29360 [Pseudomonas monteilii]
MAELLLTSYDVILDFLWIHRDPTAIRHGVISQPIRCLDELSFLLDLPNRALISEKPFPQRGEGGHKERALGKL